MLGLQKSDTSLSGCKWCVVAWGYVTGRLGRFFVLRATKSGRSNAQTTRPTAIARSTDHSGFLGIFIGTDHEPREGQPRIIETCIENRSTRSISAEQSLFSIMARFVSGSSPFSDLIYIL